MTSMKRAKFNFPLMSIVVAVLAELSAVVMTFVTGTPPALVALLVVALGCCCWQLIQLLRRVNS
jgi:hypothetical protein